MKKILILLLSMFMVLGLSAQTITVLHAGETKIGNSTDFKIAESLLKQDFPGVKVEWMKMDLSDGSTLTMDAMLAAGEAPNLYLDSMVRASKYLIPEYALPLDGLIRDMDKYLPSSIFNINGKVLGLSLGGSGQGMAINLDMMKEIGFTVKPDWTIADFLKMAELVKQKYGGKKWATGMFAANQSGDYLINNWYASFGVKWYENGNYNKALVAQNGGAKVYEFYQTLAKKGYIPPNSATLSDDDYVIQWAKGDLAATAFFPSWVQSYFDTVIQQKLIDKPFNYAFVPFPRAQGVSKVGTYINGTVAIVHKTGKPLDNAVVRLLEYLSVPEIENGQSALGILPDKVGTKPPTDPYTSQIATIVSNNGIHDFGLADKRFTERRALQYPILQQVLNFKLTPEEAIQKFEKALNGVK